MCISATVAIAGASLFAAGATLYTGIQSANANARYAQFDADMKKKELRERTQLSTIEAMQKESAAWADYERNRSRQLAAMAFANGFQGENISFFQGIDPAQREEFGDTSMAIRLGLAADHSSLADQIRVSDASAKHAKFNASMDKIGAVGNFVGQVAQAGSYYQKNRKPGG